MIKKIQVIIIFLFVGISTKFFDARFLDPSILNYVVYVSFIILIGITIPYVAPKSLGFVLPVQLIVISIFFSLLMAYISWDQSFNNSVIQTLPFMVWIVFFYLLHAKVPVKSIETIILIYGVLYTALYFFQFLNAPKIYFGQSLWGDEFTVDRGTVRIIFPGATIFVLAVFMSLNKLTTQIRGRWIWLIFLVLGIVVPVLQVTRQFIAGILLIYIYHFLRNQTVFRKAIIMMSFIGIVAVVASSDNALIKGLTEASANDSKQGEKYIRVVSAKYFLTDFSPNDLSTFFGNGSPYTGISSYGKFEQKLQERGIFLEDVGIIAMYAIFGVLSIIAYILIWYKSFVLKIPERYQYVRYYLWYLLITCFTSMYTFYPFFLIATVFALYIYQTVYDDQEKMNRVAQFLERSKLESNN